MSAGYLPPPPRTDAERGALVTANLRLVRWAVARFLKGRPHLRHLEDDLIGEGVLGLLRAAELFDPAKGAFTTIAYYWALQKVRRYAANNDAGAVRVPVGVERKERARLCKRGQARDKVGASLGVSAPTVDRLVMPRPGAPAGASALRVRGTRAGPAGRPPSGRA